MLGSFKKYRYSSCIYKKTEMNNERKILFKILRFYIWS